MVLTFQKCKKVAVVGIENPRARRREKEKPAH